MLRGAVSLVLVILSVSVTRAQEIADPEETLPPEAVAPGMLLQQIPVDLDQTWAYTTADPVRPDLLGLATQTGRYAFMPTDGCRTAEWSVADGQEVALYVVSGGAAWIAPMDALGGLANVACPIQVQSRMSTSPCFTDARGVCDVGQEFDP